MGYSRKKKKQGAGGEGGGAGLKTYFFENPAGIFRLFTLPLKICDKSNLHPWRLCKIVLHPLEIPRPKTKSSGNYT